MIFLFLSSFIEIIIYESINFNNKKKTHYSIIIHEHFQLEGLPNLYKTQNIIYNEYYFIVI